jgi:hypothetical protein
VAPPERVRHHPRVPLLAIKLLLAPSFVVGASLAARRFGSRVGGLIAGLPVVAGPILLAYAIAHGRDFAAGAAAGTLLGLVSLIGFVVVYARLAGRLSWAASMLSGWLAFARPSLQAREHAAPPSWDLPLRAGCALVLVLTLTAVSGWLGPRLSGLLAPFPIIATVMSTFTHAQRGTDELLRMLRGLISGFLAFALFCFTLAVSLRHIDTAPAFALATVLALLVQGALLIAGGARAEPALSEL